MHTVMWTINVNEGTSRQDMLDGINASAPDYKGVAGLVRTFQHRPGRQVSNRNVPLGVKIGRRQVLYEGLGNRSEQALASSADGAPGLGHAGGGRELGKVWTRAS